MKINKVGDSMSEKEKDSYFRFRIDLETKDKFQAITKRQAINSSELFRQWIENYIKENSSLVEN